MQIRDVKVYSFGKLQEREYYFTSGINVIYGANEAGKSTLHSFLLAMLFGMDKGRGRMRKDDYNRYEPWHAPAYYSGALRFVVDGRPFYLERNFYHREKREILRNEADGEELSVAYGDLAMLLGGIDKETYGNTYDIPQSGVVTGGELSKVLAEYLSDASGGGGGATHVTRAHAILAAKKKERNAELKNIQNEKEQQKNALRLEQALVGQDVERLRDDIASAKQDLKEINQKFAELSENDPAGADEIKHRNDLAKDLAVSEITSGKESVGKNRNRKSILPGIIITIIALLGLCVNCSMKAAEAYSEALFFTLQGILFAGAAGGILYAAVERRQNKKNTKHAKGIIKEAEEVITGTPDSSMKTRAITHAADIAGEQAGQMLAMLEENLCEKETRLYNITEQLEVLDRWVDREREIAQDISALEMADDEITRIAREFCEELEDELNSEVSRYVSAITEGRYDSVRVDEKGTLTVLADGKEISPEALSRGTLEQFYLALRLAVGNIVMREEPMPICLDEAFAWYDDRRLAQALKVLAATGRQILLFTCQNREMDALRELGIDYHRIDL